MKTSQLKERIKALALECGFVGASVAEATPISSADIFLNYLGQGYSADMEYLSNNIETRMNPALMLEGARSIICLAASCSPEVEDHGSPISCFYRGRDYHRVLKKRAMYLCDRIMSEAGEFASRICVDTAPVAERALAAESGLGWIGKSGMLIVPGVGNTVVLAEIITDLDLEPDKPVQPCCGDCTKCIDACPSGAICEGGLVDARKCISYHTIENRGQVEPGLRLKIGTSVFGCDRCRDVCPYSCSGPCGDEDLAPAGYQMPTIEDILGWDEHAWDDATRGKGLRRAKLWMFHRNGAIAAGNSRDLSLVGPLRQLRDSGGPTEEIDWALERLSEPNGIS